MKCTKCGQSEATDADSLCDGCRNVEGLAAVKCLNCGKPWSTLEAGQMWPYFKIEVGKTYHTERCPDCSPDGARNFRVVEADRARRSMSFSASTPIKYERVDLELRARVTGLLLQKLLSIENKGLRSVREYSVLARLLAATNTGEPLWHLEDRLLRIVPGRGVREPSIDTVRLEGL